MNTVAREGVQVKLAETDFWGYVSAEQTVVDTALNNRLGNVASDTTDGIDDKII
jgi:hypothetical protein